MQAVIEKHQLAPASQARTVLAGAIGNVLEWYDFGLFGFFAGVIAAEFFPGEDHMAKLLGAFGVFAAGFLMRPLGGVLFGYVGDRLGRKRALELSVVLMAVATTAVGILPAYATIGLAAPMILTLLRMAQGVSVGGEYIGSIAFLAEHAPHDRRAAYGSWSAFSSVTGTLLGSGAAWLTAELLTNHQLHTWGWRAAFLSGLGISVVACWLRMGVSESPDFLKLRDSDRLATNPLRESLTTDRRAILMTTGLTLLSSVGFYIPFVWVPTWLSRMIDNPMPPDDALMASTIALGFVLLFIPPLATLSDRIGRRPMFLAGAIGYATLSYPIMKMMSTGSFPAAIAGGIAFAFCHSLLSSCSAALLVELFTSRTRFTGIAIGFNLAQAIVGGTAPLVGTALVHLTGNAISPAFYLIACALISGVVAIFIKPRHGKPLDTDGDLQLEA